MTKEDDWVEYRALVLSELKRLNDHISECDENMRAEVSGLEKKLAEKLDKLNIEQVKADKEIRGLKAKVYVWTAILAAAAPYLLDLIKT